MNLSSRHWAFIAAITLFALCTALFIYMQRLEPVAYITAVVRQGDIENAVLAAGKLDAIERVDVGAQVSGQVKSLTVRLGDLVHKGQSIAEIDDLPQRNNLRNAQAALNAEKANRLARQAEVNETRAQFLRQKRLLINDASSQQDYESAKAKLAIAQASLQLVDARIVQAQIEVNNKKVDLSYTKILAPMDGTVIAIITQQGQTVNANQSAPTIVKLAQLNIMTIKAQISEVDITHISAGQKAYFTIFGDPEKRYDATLRSVELAPESVMKENSWAGSGSSASSSGSGSAAVYYNALLDVPNPDNKLRIAMTAQVSLLRSEAKQVLLIPLQAIKKISNHKQEVQVLDADNQPHTREIITGITNNVDIQVVSGLKLGEKVVLAKDSNSDTKASGEHAGAS
ncbi:MAG: secretion protein [Solimicrobium sp.]|jgi:macrolide-specific efflux system membrane fusion protein|nr:secretion protein [Solimicrobium sp.]